MKDTKNVDACFEMYFLHMNKRFILAITFVIYALE